MPISLPNTTVADSYGAAQITGNNIFKSGWITVANNSAFAQYFFGEEGLPMSSPEIFLPPGIYQIQSPKNELQGVRFRNAIAGKAAQVWGILFFIKDPVFIPSSEFTGAP